MFASTLVLRGSVVRDTKANGASEFSRGLVAAEGSDVSVVSTLVTGNQGVGALASASKLVVSGSVVRDNLSNDNGHGGSGIQGEEGSDVSVLSSLVAGNLVRGIAVSGSKLLLAGSAVVDTRSGDMVPTGVQVAEGSEASVLSSLVAGNRGSGAAIGASTLVVADSGVRDSRSDEPGKGGCGILAWDQAQVSVESSLVAGNQACGLGLAGSTLVVDRSVVRDTEALENGKLGRGITALEGSDVSILSSLVADNRETGVSVFASKLAMAGSVVRDTLADPSGYFGRGIEAREGASVSVRSSLLAGNGDAGILAYAATLVLAGSVVRDTKAGATGEFGMGVMASGGASSAVLGSSIEGNKTVGVAAGNAGTVESLRYCLVSGTGPGGLPEAGSAAFGDGVASIFFAQMDVRQSVLRGNARSGAAYDHSTGSFVGNVVAGNKWALVTQDSVLERAQADNDLACNEHPGEATPGLTAPSPPPLPDPGDPLGPLPEPPE
jgi:hypothetical protein